MSAQPEAPVVYTPEQVADILHTSGRWIRDGVRSHKFPHIRVGKGRIAITADQLTQIIELCTNKPPVERPVRTIGTRARRIK